MKGTCKLRRTYWLAFALLLLSAPVIAADKEIGSPADYDAILKKYVVGDYFQYGQLKKNAADMARF